MEIGLVETYQEKSGIGAFASGLYPELLKEDNVEQIGLDLGRKAPILDTSISLYFRIPRILKQKSEEFDVLFLPSHTMLTGINPSKINAEVAVMVHDLELYPLPAESTIQTRNRNRSIKNLKDSDYVFVPSEATRRDLARFTDIEVDKIEVIQEGVERIEKTSPLSIPENYFLYVGDLQERKNVDSLIRAFAKYDGEEHLVLAGRVYSEEDKNRIEEAVRELEIKDSVRMLGEVSKKELGYLYQNTAGYIHPAYFEGFGRTPLEAAVNGAPVAVVNGTAPSEFLENAYRMGSSSKCILKALNNISMENKEELSMPWSVVSDRVRECLRNER